MMLSRSLFALYPLLILSLVSACTRSVEGFVPAENALEKLILGQVTRSEILDEFGEPSLVSPPGSDRLIYLRRDLVASGPGLYETDRKVVVMSFNDDTRLTEIEILDQNDGINLSITSDKTPVSGVPSVNAFSDILSNIGRFSP